MRKNWSRHKIIFELHSRGLTLTQLSVDAGLAPSTLRNALRLPYPKGQQIIANALDKNPKEIWPERY